MKYSTVDRRGWLQASMAIGVGCSASGWLQLLASESEKTRTKSVILLWMNGGPATIDLWDLKPGHENGGPFREVKTTVPGLRLSEHLPKLATLGKHLAVVRSVTSKEGDHGRAAVFARTGYIPLGGILYPVVGSLIANSLADPDADLPGFVSIAPPRFETAPGGGFLGPRFAPLAVGEGATGPEGLTVPNLTRMPGVDAVNHSARLGLLDGLERQAAGHRPGVVTEAARAATAAGVRLMQPAAAEAFRLDQESDALRDSYGRNVFGQGCLLARRLVERGVSCVEVTLDGWDTHLNNFDQVRGLSGTLDSAYATLLRDLKDRGLLDTTLVVCMGEFGRTPKINGATGRDHWPKVWSAVLSGGGVKGGQAVGKTSADGTTAVDRPVTVPDIIATVCRAVGIDPMAQNLSNVGRPIRVADPTAKPIEELL